jgi:hypothetical protein
MCTKDVAAPLLCGVALGIILFAIGFGVFVYYGPDLPDSFFADPFA